MRSGRASHRGAGGPERSRNTENNLDHPAKNPDYSHVAKRRPCRVRPGTDDAYSSTKDHIMSLTCKSLALICIVGFAAVSPPAAEAGFVVAPNAYASTPGNSHNRFP